MNDECGMDSRILADGRPIVCCLPPGHSGPHWDQVEGWEW